VNLNITAPKLRAHQMGPETEIGYHEFEYISVIYGGHFPKYYCIGSIFRKITVHVLEAQT
jgi:hypothetical protein